jgi:hypothetical protein
MNLRMIIDKINMKKTTLIYLLGLCFVTMNSGAQIDRNSIRSGHLKELNISFFVGLSAIGTKSDIEHLLTKSNWDQTMPKSCFLFFCLDAKTHPYTNKLVVFDFEGTYFFTEQIGASLNIGVSDNIESTGYNSSAGTLHISSKIWSLSANFVFRPKGKRHAFILGPTLLGHSVSSERISPQSNQLRPGIFIGWSVNLIQKPNFSLPFKMVYRWSSQYEIGPFRVIPGDSGSSAPPLQGVSVNPGSLNIGLAMIFRHNSQ